MNAEKPYDRTHKGMTDGLTKRSTEATSSNVPDVRMAPRRRGAWRQAAETALWVLIAAIACESWYITGLFRPLVVPGGSMAPTLLGTHRTVVCENCGFRFHCGSDLQPVAHRAVCPNCGCAENDLAACGDVPGDRILLHRSAFLFRRPRRWEVVAFRDPVRSERLAVKRVVGLPGEIITLSDGNVYANGRICRKPLWLQREMAVLVNDAGFCSGRRCDWHETGTPPQARESDDDAANPSQRHWLTDHWITNDPQTAWSYADGRFTHTVGRCKRAGASQNDSVDWLTFCSGRFLPQNSDANHLGKWLPSPLTDLCGYNQTRPRRAENVHAVGDVMLCLRVARMLGRGKMFIRISDSRSEFSISLAVDCSTEKRAAAGPGTMSIGVCRDGHPLSAPPCRAVQLPAGFAEEGFLLELSLFDRCLLVAIDGKEVVHCPYGSDRDCKFLGNEPSQQTAALSSQPLAIGSDRLGVVLEAVRVYRDVYYGGPAGLPIGSKERCCTHLGEAEYYLLGDNSPISIDSRHWAPRRTVTDNLLLGKPLAAH